MKKNENVYIIIWGVVIGLSLLITICCYALNDTLDNNKENNPEDKYTNTGNKDNDNSNDSSSLIVGYEADTPEEFINYLNEYDHTKYLSYAVTYNLIEVRAIRNEDKNGYKYKVYYGGVEVEYSGLKEGDFLINGGKFYLLEDNKNKAFVLVNEIGAVAEVSRYLVLIFDINGNILMSEVVYPQNNTEIKVSNNMITYSYYPIGRFPGEMLDCEYEGNIDYDMAILGDKEIKYSNGELSVVKDTKKTIGDYKSSCN